MGTVTLDAADLTTREINARLRELPDGAHAVITQPRGRHNLAVGLTNRIGITIDGNAGYYIGGLGDGPEITVNGFTGWGVGENLMSGVIRVKGSVSQSAAASAHGGLVIVEGDASLRAGISLKGATIAIAGDAGNLAGFMAQAGTILIGGDAGEALGDSLYETVIYVAGPRRGRAANRPHRRRRDRGQGAVRPGRLRARQPAGRHQGDVGPAALPLLVRARHGLLTQDARYPGGPR
jgi:glutamate synthase domain-containing protein 3